MKHDHLTASELIHYLDLTSTDPIVRRLISILHHENIKTELIELGMDPVDYSFEYDGISYRGPKEYIEQLHNEIDYYKKESDEWEAKCEEAQAESERLKVRSVATLLFEMEQAVKSANDEVLRAKLETKKVQLENRDLHEKINVWNILEN